MKPRTAGGGVLVSWLARNNDPFERDRSQNVRVTNGVQVAGPTLTLLFDADSPYRGRIDDVLMLYRQVCLDKEDSRIDQSLVAQTFAEISKRAPRIRCQKECWTGDDPTDHGEIFAFLRSRMTDWRRRFEGRELIIHISPGTPSMQTVWLLMAECGFIEEPFTTVKSYRPDERRGRKAVSRVEIGIESFYKVYRSSRPKSVSVIEEEVFWDPGRFQSERLRSLYSEAKRYARLRVPILILGERGTGKTTLASWIRSNSPFRKPQLDTNWPSIVCGQYTAETMRAELCGYKKGSFTGADRDHAGLLAAADGDTLFLDEIGDVSRDVQRLLIRAVEEGKYQPLGSVECQQSNFRLIAATNLGNEEVRKRLDADFLDRIRQVSLTVPALREIRDDLPWIWDSVYARAIQSSGLDGVQCPVSREVRNGILTGLSKHVLQGNMRDLFRVAYRLIAAVNDESDRLADNVAMEYALAGLGPSESSPLTKSQAHAIASGFSRGEALSSIIGPDELVRTCELDLAFKSYLAEGIRELAQLRRLTPDQICDVSSRTLRNWKATDVRQGSSNVRKRSSAQRTARPK